MQPRDARECGDVGTRTVMVRSRQPVTRVFPTCEVVPVRSGTTSRVGSYEWPL